MAAIWVNITDILWPVGSVYYTTTGTTENSPASLFGGSWTGPVQVTDSTGASFYRYIRVSG